MMDARGQSVLDYGMAMGVFLLAVAFTFAIAPTFLNPLLVTVNDDAVAHSERVGDVIVGEVSDPVGQTPSNATINSFFATHGSNESRLRAFVGLPRSYSLNVSVWNGTEQIHAAGSQYSTATEPVTATRIISIRNETCHSTCRVEVRIW